MRLLFDTHAFLWWHSERARLSPRVLEVCEQPENSLFLSMASIWEIQIKHNIDKLKLTRPLENIIEMERERNAIELLPIALPHILELYQLPHHHRDPFDRILIAQSRSENLTLMSSDPMIAQYPVTILW